MVRMLGDGDVEVRPVRLASRQEDRLGEALQMGCCREAECTGGSGAT